MVDQNGTTHKFTFDKLGRGTADEVVSLGLGIDGAVRKLAPAYDVRGLVQKITSYNAAGSVVNEVQQAYNGLMQLVAQSQAHAGAVGMGTPVVNYGYDVSASGGAFTKGARPVSVTYPDGRVVAYSYGSSGSAGDTLARVAALEDGAANVYAAYSYLGLGAFVIADYQAPDVRLDYTAAASGDAKYPGFDRFGRVIDQRWEGYGASPGNRDRFQYGYDRNSNRLYRANGTATGFDELYAYDRINRLVNFQRGTLAADKKSITGTPAKAQTWGLDATGNWPRFTSASDGAFEVDQTRTHNGANEITSLSAWFQPKYDAAGNMTATPKPAAPGSGFKLVYDAWNRLVRVEDVDACGCADETVAEYQYDGQHRRTVKRTFTGGVLSETRHFYYSSAWQVLEERIGAAVTPNRQYVWGLRYIDDLILRDRDTDGDGSLDERLFALQDANWNVTSVVNASGATQERYTYTAYGEPSFLNAAYVPLSDSAFAWETLFTGREQDSETELLSFRRRYYLFGIGRFTSRDPVGYVNGPNIYQAYFVPNSVDPFGLQAPGINPPQIIGNNAAAGKPGASAPQGVELLVRLEPITMLLTPKPVVNPQTGACDPTEENILDIVKKRADKVGSPRVFQMSGANDANDQLRRGTGLIECIGRLMINAHGGEGGFYATSTNNPNKAKEVVKVDWQDTTLEVFGGFFRFEGGRSRGLVNKVLFENVPYCDSCVITILACNACDGAKGEAFLREIAMANKRCRVECFTRFVDEKIVRGAIEGNVKPDRELGPIEPKK